MCVCVFFLNYKVYNIINIKLFSCFYKKKKHYVCCERYHKKIIIIMITTVVEMNILFGQT